MFQNVKYLGAALTNRNEVHYEIKRIMAFGNAFMPSLLISKTVMILSAFQNAENQDIKINNFAGCFVWV
jgi:hypothetical protein